MQQSPIAPPAPPLAPNQVVFRAGSSSPTAVYEAYTAQRDELGRQLERLQDRRREITQQMEDGANNPGHAGLVTSLASVDERIQAVEKQISAADAQVAQAAAIPGAVAGHLAQERAWRLQERNGPPEEVFVISGLFIVVALLPISLAVARRIWRRSSSAVAAIPGELMERMSRLDQSVEAIAIEVERIGEGQRFMTRVLSDTNGRAREALPAERKS